MKCRDQRDQGNGNVVQSLRDAPRAGVEIAPVLQVLAKSEQPQTQQKHQGKCACGNTAASSCRQLRATLKI